MTPGKVCRGWHRQEAAGSVTMNRTSQMSIQSLRVGCIINRYQHRSYCQFIERVTFHICVILGSLSHCVLDGVVVIVQTWGALGFPRENLFLLRHSAVFLWASWPRTCSMSCIQNLLRILFPCVSFQWWPFPTVIPEIRMLIIKEWHVHAALLLNFSLNKFLFLCFWSMFVSKFISLPILLSLITFFP